MSTQGDGASPRHPGGRESGSLSLESAIILGPVFMLLLLIIQVGLYEHARDVARSAAQVGAQAGRGIDTPAGLAQQASTRYLADVGGLYDVRVETSSGPQVSVTVTGRMPSIVPLLSLPAVTATATLPKEQLSSP